MTFVRSVEKADYEQKLSEVINRLRGEGSVLTGSLLSLWFGSDDLCNKWIESNEAY